jgi:hypothetical protein
MCRCVVCARWDAEEADLGTEMLGIGRHFEERSGTGLKQEREQDLLILPD